MKNHLYRKIFSNGQMLQKPRVQIIQINDPIEKNNKVSIKTYAIVQLPTNKNSIILPFDRYCSPSFQGLNQYDIFDEYDEALESIKCSNKSIPEIRFEGIAIAGMVKNSLEELFLLLIKEAEPIRFQNQELFFKVISFTLVQLNTTKKKVINYDVKNYFYSFDSDILSFRDHKNNKNYNYFHVIQKSFRRLQINVCPFVINGHIVQHAFSCNLEILLICRRSASSKAVGSDISQDNISSNQSEIEMVISEQKNDGIEISFFTTTFGGKPFSYSKKDDANKTSYIISLNETPMFVFNLLGNRKEKMKNDIYFIDTSDNNQFSIDMRKAISFLSGVFRIQYLPIKINTEISKEKIYDQIYEYLPNIKLRKQFIIDEVVYYLEDCDQIFYVCSNIENFSAEFVSTLLICKAFNSLNTKFQSIESEFFNMVSPFLQSYNDPMNKFEYGYFSDFFGIRPITSNNDLLNKLWELSRKDNNDFTHVENMERCVSLFPTATIVDPIDVDHHILSLNQTIFYFYQTPEKPIIISLAEVCRVTSIRFNPPNKSKGHLFNILPSMVTVYGGLYINQMFPIVENLSLSWTVETIFRIKSKDFYSTDLKYSKYGKVRFMSFHFTSLFKAFYIPNIQVYSDGSNILKFPKNIKKDTITPIKIDGNLAFIQNESQRIINNESISLFIFKNRDEIQSLIDVNNYFEKVQMNQFLLLKYNQYNDTLTKNELIMMVKKYPFLLNKTKLKCNFIKSYSSDSIYIPLLLASGPPLFEYVINQQSNLSDFTAFEPKENIVILKLVLLQSYNADLIEVRCNNPLLLEILNDCHKKYTFLPPGEEQKLSILNKKILDIKIIGNPISISFLGIRPDKVRSTFENDSFIAEDDISEGKCSCKSRDSSIVILGKESISNYFENSQYEIKGPPKKMIGFKFNLPRGVNPRFLLFDDNLPIFVRANSDAVFFLPEIKNSNKIKVICQGVYAKQRLHFNASFIELADNQDIQNSFQEVIDLKPSQILFTNH